MFRSEWVEAWHHPPGCYGRCETPFLKWTLHGDIMDLRLNPLRTEPQPVSLMLPPKVLLPLVHLVRRLGHCQRNKQQVFIILFSRFACILPSFIIYLSPRIFSADNQTFLWNAGKYVVEKNPARTVCC